MKRILLAMLCLPAMALADTLTITCPGAITITTTPDATTYTCQTMKVPPPPSPAPPVVACAPAPFTVFPGKSQPQFPVIPHGGVSIFKVPAASGAINVTTYSGMPSQASIEYFFSRCPGVKDAISAQPACSGFRGYYGDKFTFASAAGLNTCVLPAGDNYFSVRNARPGVADSCPYLPNTGAGCTVVVQWND